MTFRDGYISNTYIDSSSQEDARQISCSLSPALFSFEHASTLPARPPGQRMDEIVESFPPHKLTCCLLCRLDMDDEMCCSIFLAATLVDQQDIKMVSPVFIFSKPVKKEEDIHSFHPYASRSLEHAFQHAQENDIRPCKAY